jgi:16S rRNA A1518/A1519 N6-dimethyltransferase RsmA/KsgA/DIM1 with predicted DNA glycosylase/AP lyase activity
VEDYCDISALADPRRGQHFLMASDKLSKLVEAAGIRPTDDVLEVGAGIGTVARVLPECENLTVVELDARLVKFLQKNVPRAVVLQRDALDVVQHLSFDVLIGNLPHKVTDSLIAILPRLSFRTAVLSVAESADLTSLDQSFSWSEVTRTTGSDFLPPQPVVSRIVRVVPRPEGDGSIL